MGWEEVGFVKASQVRTDVLRALQDRPLAPKDITKALDLHFPQVSTALTELTGKGLVKCLTHGRVKGKIYGVTEAGVTVLGRL